MKTTLEQIKKWNGKIYDNAVYLDGKKVEDIETVNELKKFQKVYTEYYNEWEILKREEKKEELLTLLFHKKEELIYGAINNGLFMENEGVGKQLIIGFYFNNEFNPERWNVDEILKDDKLRSLI
tara:strand:- start:2 stop:373 length:372 start_codon:yes stop_codon:yes gene_type:complete